MTATVKLIMAAFLLLQFSAFAQTARIDVQSPDKKVGMVFHDASEDVAVYQAGWQGDVDKDKRICAEVSVGKGDWREISFSFVPKASGPLQIDIMGGKGVMTEYGSISSTGAELKNGDFSKLDAKGVPEAWSSSGKPVFLPSSVKADHDNRATQRIQVEAGKPVTISFKARVAE
jgi:hypothetical protein